MADLGVARTILEQLGGNKFIVMTGAKYICGDKDSLQFRIPRNKSKANFVKITLNPLDLYDMEFKRIIQPRLNHKTFTFTEGRVDVVKEFKDIYCAQLQELFTEVTGMYTKLF